MARSKCYLQLGEASSALEDAEASLKEDKKYHRVGMNKFSQELNNERIIFHALRVYTRRQKHCIQWVILSMLLYSTTAATKFDLNYMSLHLASRRLRKPSAIPLEVSCFPSLFVCLFVGCLLTS